MIEILRSSLGSGAFGEGFKPGMCATPSKSASLAMAHRWSDHPANGMLHVREQMARHARWSDFGSKI